MASADAALGTFLWSGGTRLLREARYSVERQILSVTAQQNVLAAVCADSGSEQRKDGEGVLLCVSGSSFIVKVRLYFTSTTPRATACVQGGRKKNPHGSKYVCRCISMRAFQQYFEKVLLCSTHYE